MPTIQQLPGHDRPRERLLARGADALSDQELLALVLRNGRAGESALDLAAGLMAEFRGLSGIATARPEELARRPGVGLAKAAALVAAFRLARLAQDPPALRTMRSAAEIAAVAVRELASARRERVLVLVCNSGNRLLRVVPVTEGSIDRSMLPVREVLNAVLRHDGRAFAIAHNHPSGDPTPSETDRRTTGEVGRAAGIVGLRFLDHIVVAGDRWERATALPQTHG